MNDPEHAPNRRTGVSPVEPSQNDEAPASIIHHGRDGRATDQALFQMRYGAYLPHWTHEGGTYSVTFRLADSLPQSVVRVWKAERADIVHRAKQQGRPLTRAERDRLQELFSERIEKHLDAGQGACWMNRPEIAELVADALRHFDGQRYLLLAWCVMPNHVHAVLQPFPGHELETILHSWKSFTAHQATKRFNIPAPFWQPEYYDHLIRDEADLFHAIDYTIDNPRAAGLKKWPWVSVTPDLKSFLERRTGVSPVEPPSQS